MAVVLGSSDVSAVPKLADEKCTRKYIFHHNIASKSKENLSKLKFLEVPTRVSLKTRLDLLRILRNRDAQELHKHPVSTILILL